MTLTGLLVGLGDLPTREVTASDIQNLAFAVELFHGLPDLFPWARAVHMVHLVEVDVIGLEPLETGLTGFADVEGGKAGRVGPIPHGAEDLGGQDHLIAAAPALGEPAPH